MFFTIFSTMLQVTCAVIERNGRLLICQRSATMKLPLKWEFPGGKIETNESKADCLHREIQEELGLRIRIGQSLSPVVYAYPTFTICLYPFLCELIGGDLLLAEHTQALWIAPSRLLNFDWAEADIPIVQELLNRKLI